MLSLEKFIDSYPNHYFTHANVDNNINNACNDHTEYLFSNSWNWFSFEIKVNLSS